MMWVFTKHGFFSAVENFKSHFYIHVRARFRGDLESLCYEYGIQPRVVVTKYNDYPYRMDFRRVDWATILEREGKDIDYTDFEKIAKRDPKRAVAYSEIWKVLQRFGD